MRDLDWTSYDVIVVDDEPDNLDAFRFAFRKSFKLHFAPGGREALALLSEVDPAVIVADQRMPGMSGVELLQEAKQRRPEVHGILLTAFADLDVLIAAVNGGAVNRYVQKPWDSKEFAVFLRQGIDNFVTVRENRKLREQLAQYAGYLEKQQRDPMDFGQIVGGGEATELVLSRVAELAESDAPVVIEGEHGLEKDVVARAIHTASLRESRPFVSVTCTAFRGEALERELFGYQRGAFDGAYQARAGRFELADGGTLHLGEPSEFSPALQARLLRLLNDGEVERMGETTARRVDVRLVMSVTPSLSVFGSVPLIAELSAKLSILPIELTPLRSRREDLRPLAEHFLRKYGQRNRRAATSMTAEAMIKIERYDWPGNVRELENVVERAAILARGDEIRADHLLFQSDAVDASQQTATTAGLTTTAASSASSGVSLSRRLDAIERRELMAALEKHGGNKAEVARALGIQRTTLYYRLKKLGIDA